MGEPAVLVRSRILKGSDIADGAVAAGAAIAAAAAELEVLLRVEAQRLGVDVDEVSDVRVQDDLMGSWVRVTRTAIGRKPSGGQRL